jgi:hypothetical protein
MAARSSTSTPSEPSKADPTALTRSCRRVANLMSVTEWELKGKQRLTSRYPTSSNLESSFGPLGGRSCLLEGLLTFQYNVSTRQRNNFIAAVSRSRRRRRARARGRWTSKKFGAVRTEESLTPVILESQQEVCQREIGLTRLKRCD